MRSKQTRIIALVLHLATLAASACIAETDLASQPAYNSSYCLPVLQWPTSGDTIANVPLYDAYALGNYTLLYQQYYSTGLVDINCLGAAKYFFCAAAFPVCTPDAENLQKICSWICNVVSIRCAAASPVYEALCAPDRVDSSNCSSEWALMNPTLLAVIYLTYLFLC